MENVTFMPGFHSESIHTSSACRRSASPDVLPDRSGVRVGVASRLPVGPRPVQTRCVADLHHSVGIFPQCSLHYHLVTKMYVYCFRRLVYFTLVAH